MTIGRRRSHADTPGEDSHGHSLLPLRFQHGKTFFYPTWWGTVPALLKAFFERLFLPGFAFHYREDSPFPEQLLKGRSARLVVTMDAPAWYDRLFYGAASRRAIRRNILEYCGIRPVQTTVIDRIRNRSEKERSRMIEQMRSLGAQLA